jgi:hypothetical protein
MQNCWEAVVKALIFHSYEPYDFPFLTEVLPGGIEAVISALMQHEDKDGPAASFSAIGSTIGDTSSTPSKLKKVRKTTNNYFSFPQALWRCARIQIRVQLRY